MKSIKMIASLVAIFLLASCEKKSVNPRFDIKRYKIERCMGCKPRSLVDTTIKIQAPKN